MKHVKFWNTCVKYWFVSERLKDSLDSGHAVSKQHWMTKIKSHHECTEKIQHLRHSIPQKDLRIPKLTLENQMKSHSSLSFLLLIILKSALFRGFRVYELKFRSKKDNGIIFFQWKLWCCFFQIWNPGGLQEAFRNCILVRSFDFLSKSAEKTTNIAHLKIGAHTYFDGRYVTKPKIFSKQDRGIIFFK